MPIVDFVLRHETDLAGSARRRSPRRSAKQTDIFPPIGGVGGEGGGCPGGRGGRGEARRGAAAGLEAAARPRFVGRARRGAARLGSARRAAAARPAPHRTVRVHQVRRELGPAPRPRPPPGSERRKQEQSSSTSPPASSPPPPTALAQPPRQPPRPPLPYLRRRPVPLLGRRGGMAGGRAGPAAPEEGTEAAGGAIRRRRRLCGRAVWNIESRSRGGRGEARGAAGGAPGERGEGRGGARSRLAAAGTRTAPGRVRAGALPPRPRARVLRAGQGQSGGARGVALDGRSARPVPRAVPAVAAGRARGPRAAASGPPVPAGHCWDFGRPGPPTAAPPWRPWGLRSFRAPQPPRPRTSQLTPGIRLGAGAGCRLGNGAVGGFSAGLYLLHLLPSRKSPLLAHFHAWVLEKPLCPGQCLREPERCPGCPASRALHGHPECPCGRRAAPIVVLLVRFQIKNRIRSCSLSNQRAKFWMFSRRKGIINSSWRNLMQDAELLNFDLRGDLLLHPDLH
ncbi:uncharacterized protein [Patagioenas fasciata]|uniref:uncharacterized protein n=1 Tax=Patagioenas fasciata TaxID=372321 RepID=UPI003A9982C9